MKKNGEIDNLAMRGTIVELMVLSRNFRKKMEKWIASVNESERSC